MDNAGSHSVALSHTAPHVRSAWTRRDFLRVSGIGLAGAALFGLSACDGEDGQGTAGVQTLTFSMSPPPAGTNIYNDLISRFNADHEGEVEVRLREMPADTGQYLDQVRTEFQAGDATIDIIGGDVIWPAQLAANGWIADLSDRFTDDMRSEHLTGMIEANTFEGNVYGVPWFGGGGLLYYRQDLLEAAGFAAPPTTWAELKEMAAKIQRDEGTQYGYVFQGANYEGGLANGMEFIWNAGGDVLDSSDPTRVVVDGPEAIRGLETQRSMVTDGVSPEAVATYKEPESHTAFLRGDAVFLRNWVYVLTLAATSDEFTVTPEQIGTAPLPAEEGQESSTVLGGWNLFVNATSDKQDAAWEFIQYMTAPEQQRANALAASNPPSLLSLYEDQELLDQVADVAANKVVINDVRPRPVSPYYSDMSLVIAERFNAALRGDASSEEALTGLRGDLEDIIAASGS